MCGLGDRGINGSCVSSGPCSCVQLASTQTSFCAISLVTTTLQLIYSLVCRYIGSSISTRRQRRLPPPPSGSVAALGAFVACYLNHSLAPNTFSTYRSGWSSYQHFCFVHGLPPLPPTETVLSTYVSHLADRRITHGTINVYLSAVAYHSQLSGHRIDYSTMPTLRYVLAGIRRLQGNSLLRPKRAPITTRHLARLRAYIAQAYPPRDALMLWAAFSSAFFGLLRSSEYCSPTTTTLAPSTLLRRHLRFATDLSSASLFLPISKTDQSARGANISFFALSSPLCPVSALWHFALLPHSYATTPLFLLTNGDFLTREIVVEVLRAAFPGRRDINTHSFRIGGATALAQAGVPDYIIQINGRWPSDFSSIYPHPTRIPTHFPASDARVA